MTCKSKCSFLFFLISLLFSGCKFVSLNQSSTAIEIKLPEVSATRSVYSNPNGFSGELNGDGKFPKSTIDEYEVSVTSSKGKVIVETASAGSGSIIISDIDVGECLVNFTAYAVDKKDGMTERTVIAKNREPIKAVIIEDETVHVEIKAEYVKYIVNNSPFVDGKDEISMNISSPGYQFVLDGNYMLPISQLIKFEVQGDVVSITKDGLIIPKKTGEANISYSRLQDGKFGKQISVVVLPVVKINCFVNGVNVSSKYSSTKVVEDSGDMLANRLMNFSMEPITAGEKLDCDWYFDSDFTLSKKIEANASGSFSLYQKYVDLVNESGGSNVIEINVYADTGRRIDTLDQLKTAFSDDRSGNILVTGLFTINDTISLNIKKNMEITGLTVENGIDGNDLGHLEFIGDNVHSLKLNKLEFINGKSGTGVKGGVIYAEKICGLVIENCKFSGNRIDETKDNNGDDGGSIYLTDCSDVSIKDCNFYRASNVIPCSCSGGFVYIDSNCSGVSIDKSVFEGAYAAHGGALALRSDASVSGCTFEKNIADYRGGAINIGAGATVDVSNCIFNNNTGPSGQDIYTCDATANVTGCKDRYGNDISRSTCSYEGTGGISFY